ncbi:MAG: cytochrome c oxidase assembly factor Coa1 family protein [Pyrinomonadaceae bacterium]
MTTKKLVVIIGSIIAGLLLVIALIVGAIVGGVFYTIGRSEATQTAKDFLRSNEKLKQDIGEVKDFGYFVTGSINSRNDDGDASLNLKVIGERREARATVTLMYRQGKNWRVTDAYYRNEAGQTVSLLDKYGAETPER